MSERFLAESEGHSHVYELRPDQTQFNGMPMDKEAIRNHEPVPDLSAEEQELSNEVRAEFFDAVDRTIAFNLEKNEPARSEKDRKIEPLLNNEGKQIALLDVIRDRSEKNKERLKNHQEYVFVLDFDDVLNKTTEFNKKIEEAAVAAAGITPGQFRELYESSKIENEEGKKVLRMEKLIETLDEMHPGAKKEMDSFFETTDFSSYIDEGVKRAVQSIRYANPDKTIWTTPPAPPRFLVLTYGDPEYQHMRLKKSGIEQTVHEVIYTEGSKREVVEGLHDRLLKENGQEPFIITVDDSPDHIEDYEKLPFEDNYANVRFRAPGTKRFAKKDTSKSAIDIEENQQKDGAVNLLRLAEVIYKSHGIWNEKQKNSSRKELFEQLRDPQKYKEILRPALSATETNQQYSKDGALFTREVNTTASGRYNVTWYKESENGTVSELSPLNEKMLPSIGSPMNFNWEEYIREAK